MTELETNVMPAGSVSVSETPVACAEPLLVTSISKTTVSPSTGVLSPLASDLIVTKSASASMVTVSSKSSPAVLGSG